MFAGKKSQYTVHTHPDGETKEEYENRQRAIIQGRIRVAKANNMIAQAFKEHMQSTLMAMGIGREGKHSKAQANKKVTRKVTRRSGRGR